MTTVIYLANTLNRVYSVHMGVHGVEDFQVSAVTGGVAVKNSQRQLAIMKSMCPRC